MPNTDYDSLFDYLLYKNEDKQTENKTSENKTEFYFRGHPDSSYLLLAPAIFRESKLTETKGTYQGKNHV